MKAGCCCGFEGLSVQIFADVSIEKILTFQSERHQTAASSAVETLRTINNDEFEEGLYQT